MAFYTYRQNNSGGGFVSDADRGISIAVIIEARSAELANAMAQIIGLYFDGSGDCPCCGDRWYEASSSCGTEDPQVYGVAPEYDLKAAKENAKIDPWSDRMWVHGDEPVGYIHYLDGRVVEFY
jgi:hypothetical protein